MFSATFSAIGKFLGDLFTEADGKTWDLGRLLWALGVAVFLYVSYYVYVIKGQAFEPTTWGIGFAGVLASGGGMIWLKDKERPAPKEGKD